MHPTSLNEHNRTISMADIARRGAVRIEHDASRGADAGSGFTIALTHGQTLLIGTCVGSGEELDALLGSVAGWTARDHVARGTYWLELSPLEIMGLRGEIVERVARQDWSA